MSAAPEQPSIGASVAVSALERQHDPEMSAPQTPDTSFVPQLDARQRAMLVEMGVRVWAPRPAAEAERKALSTATATTPVTRTVQAPEPQPPLPSQPEPSRPSAPQRAVAPPTPRTSVVAPAGAAETTFAPPAEGIGQMDWSLLENTVAACRACGLCENRRNTVFGGGSASADWMVVGEAPGETEDREGQPFVGPAGELLDNMLRAVGRSRSGSGAQGAYITNALKCRPPSNRNPQPAEVVQCAPYLARQVALLQPKIILAMGRFAVQSLLQTDEPIGKLRGRVHHYQGVPVIVTYHPAYLLRSPSDKAKAWADLCLAMDV
jgi:uracil-DNA glycosylase family 4